MGDIGVLTADEILDRASKIVDERWCQGQLMDFAGMDDGQTITTPGGNLMTVYKYPVCAVGAIREVTFGDPEGWDDDERKQEGYTDAVNALQRATGVFSIPGWNDDPDRTSDDVATAMRDAARLVREEEGR